MDVIDLRDFYASDLGATARRLLTHRLRAHWRDLADMNVVGFGFASAYLNGWRAQTHSTICLMPDRLGVIHWPTEGLNAAALMNETAIPLPESSIDRALIVHGLEMTDTPEDLLRGIWRVLKPGGRLLVVVPNRRGMWARFDHTPFGQGRPFSRGQLTKYLRDAMFQPEAWSTALFAPPTSTTLFRRSATAWERLGMRFWPAFAGVLVVEATKQVYGAVLDREGKRAFQRPRPVFVPAPASYDGAFKQRMDGA